MNEQQTRGHEHEIEIAAPIDLVWKAITNAAELSRWYVQEARVEEKEGGRYWVSWGSGQEGASRIEVFEPNQRLRLAQEPFEGSEGCAGSTMVKPQKPII